LTGSDCVAELRRRAQALGFQACRITPAECAPETLRNYREFLAQGFHGDMTWLGRDPDRRASPRVMWAPARSAIMLGLSYLPDDDPLSRNRDSGLGNISVYAHGRDYHEVIKAKLRELAGWLAGCCGGEARVFVDTAPLLEKPLAAAAGIGWQGKHTNLVSRTLGSWFFLGAILTSLDLPHDEPEDDHCGTCHACLDICPTRAFPAPYRLDARRCISYLTIEHKGHIAREFRDAMGNRIFGCDDCLAVCPWNKFAVQARDSKLEARAAIRDARIAELLRLDDGSFRSRFAGTAIKRTGRDRFVRNVLIAAGNSGDAALVPQVVRLLEDASPLVRAMAVWALMKLDRERFLQERPQRAAIETDGAVEAEWLSP
jgi:epoxyqueuosine reductase